MADFIKEGISILFSKEKVDLLKQMGMFIKVTGKMESLTVKEFFTKRNQVKFRKVYGKMDNIKVNFLMDVQKNIKLCLRIKSYQLNFLIIL
jgi:hypothetical protein